MSATRALRVHAGPTARRWLAERGLQPADVKVVAGAAGGPKGLTLLPLDEFIFGHWLGQGRHAVDLVGSSIGAWRLAAACVPDPVAALRRLGHDYIHERYGIEQGRMPGSAEVSRRFALTLRAHFADHVPALIRHPRWRLHIVTSAGQGMLRRPGRFGMALGFPAAVGLNALHRRFLSVMLQRTVFASTGHLPAWMADGADNADGAVVQLDAANFEPALLASCTIPFWLDPVRDIPGTAPGAHWDGGLTDYHMHLPYARLEEGLALIPHFQPQLVPGWLDKPLHHRHRATAWLDRAVVLSPSPEWIARLPGGKIPDRSDFKRHRHQPELRESLWSAALQASRQLADEWADLVQRPSIDAQALP